MSSSLFWAVTQRRLHTHISFALLNLPLPLYRFFFIKLRSFFASKLTSCLGKLPVTRHVLIYHEIISRDTVTSGGKYSLIHTFRLDLTCITNIMDCATKRKVAGLIPGYVIGIFH
jgi:hypothetical protein